jgi:hypothetical protein
MRRNGWVKGPCHGCGQGENHEKDQVCHRCKRLLAIARESLEQAARAEAEGTLKPFTWVGVAWAMPGYYGMGVDGRQVQQAMFGIVAALSRLMPEGTSQGEYPGGDSSQPFDYWPAVIQGGRDDYRDWRRVVQMRPVDQAAVQALDTAMREAIGAAYDAGKKAGRNLLMGLASGEVSVGKFNAATVAADTKGNQ